MLKRLSLRRFCIATLLLLVAIILNSYPKELNSHIDAEFERQNIYLIDLNNLVAMTDFMVKDNSNKLSLVKEVVNCMTVGNICDTGDFKKIIPNGTRLLEAEIVDSILKINFNSNFLGVSADNEESLIESLIFSLTEIDGISKIMIFVEGEHLLKLPHSEKKLDLYLDRSFGINKIYDIDKITNTSLVTVYYLGSNGSYYVPVSYITNNNEDDKLEIIIKSLKTNVFNFNNLSSLLDYQVELMDYEIVDDVISLNFNDVLLSSVFNGELKEEVKYAIYYSVRDTLDLDNMVFNISNKEIDRLGLAK